MEKPIICLTSKTSLGNSFLDWTIHYLSGTVNFLHVDQQYTSVQRSKLKTNPLTFESSSVGDSHNHPKNHPHGSVEVEKTLATLKPLKQPDELLSIYAQPLSFIETANKKYGNINFDFVNNKKKVEDLRSLCKDDYNKIFNICEVNSIPVIYLEDNIWNCTYKPRHKVTLDSDGKKCWAKDYKEVIFNHINWCFPDSKHQFDDNIWDTREYLALHLRPYEQNDWKIDYSYAHYFVEANSLWTDGEHTIKHIMDYLNLSINKDRYNSWYPIYKTWQGMHLARLRLPQNIDYVCNAIINGYSHDLTQYNLDLYDEAFIQHMLVYKHHLTLQNWELYKFPSNTKDITPLLEEAFYANLQDLYV